MKQYDKFLSKIIRHITEKNIVIKKCLFHKKHNNSLFYINNIKQNDIEKLVNYINLHYKHFFNTFKYVYKFKNYYLFNVQLNTSLIGKKVILTNNQCILIYDYSIIRYNNKIKNFDLQFLDYNNDTFWLSDIIKIID